VRRIQPTDLEIVRAVRLRALETDPGSFGSTYEREAAFTDDVWKDRIARGGAGDDATTLLALRGDEGLGVVSAFRDDSEPKVFDVVGMWVAPAVRRTGLGRRLLEAIEGWIAASGGTEVRLSVTNAATAAQRLYESAGYELDGRSEPSRHTPGLVEIGLRKRLGERFER
jgi:ribosomal protein S18 acetylase RimI-like enzyme